MKTHRLLLFFALLFLMAACIGRRQAATMYYLLDYPIQSETDFAPGEDEQRFTGPVLVLPVTVHPAFSTHQIAIREGTHQINYFSFNEWAVRPAQSFSELTRRFIKGNAWFGGIRGLPSEVMNGYSLSANIMGMEVVSKRQVFAASLSLEFNLTDNQSGQTFSSGVVSRSRVLKSKSLNLFAQAISELYLEELHDFLSQSLSSMKDE